MRTKLLIGLLVLGLAVAGFSTLGLQTARAFPVPHTVDGTVGPQLNPGPGNPSNLASAVFYLTNKPAYPLQTLPDLFDADGSSAAYYGKDVGSNWSEGSLLWAAGDNMVVVVETIRGQNGWTGSNWTTSSDYVLTTANIDMLPAATHEAFPTLALQKSPGAINVQWTGLLDANGNVLSYEVYRATSLAGPWPVIGRSGLQNPGGAMNFNDGGLAQGSYCYKIAANYRRDSTGGVYTTTGTSEPSCTVLGAAPTIQTTSPAANEPSVALNAMVTIVFSEAMDTTSFTATLNPPGGITFIQAWDAPQMRVTLTHATPFVQCTTYRMTVTARDVDDNFPLGPGPVPNPWNFTTTCPSPQITITSPVSSTTGVSRTANVVVTFSKPMDTATVTATPSPAVTFVSSWNGPTNTILTLTHATPFAACTWYNITVAGQDTTGNRLIAGPVPNPFTFRSNCLPRITVSAPASAVCWSGGTAHDIAWTVSDETPTGSLLIGLYYSVAGGPRVTIAPASAGRTSPYTWGVPGTVNSASVVVTVEATDAAGDIGSQASGTFEIDSTAPTVVSTSPTDTLQNVLTNSPIVITFSEAMTPAAAAGAVRISPNVANTSSWNTPTNTVLTIRPTSLLTANTPYTVTIGTGAVDACSPGTGLGSAYVFSFRTSPVRPKAPTSVSGAPSSTSVTLTWIAPTQYEDGSNLPASAIQGYLISRREGLTGPWVNVTSTPVGATSFTDSGLAPSTTYYYWVRTETTNNVISDYSSPAAQVTTQANAPDLTWLWILLIIIIVVVLIIALLAMRRRKKPEAVRQSSSSGPAEEPPAPAEDTPMEGGTEESGDTL